MVTKGQYLDALSRFLGGLAELSERTGVGIHATDTVELDADGQRFAFTATCRDDGSFAYALNLTREPVTSLAGHPARLASGETT